MNEKLLREMKNNSPNFIRKRQNNNIIYMNYITNRSMMPINNIGFYEKTTGQNPDGENYFGDFHPTMRNKNIIKSKLNVLSEDLSSHPNSINNIITNLKIQNKTFKSYINECENELLSKDNEIENYKIKVQALLGQVKDKNKDLNMKSNIINTLTVEKENNINNLQITYKDNEKYQKENEYLRQVIQNISQNKKINLKLNGFQGYEYDNDNMENEKNLSDYGNDEENNKSKENEFGGFNNLIINSFGLIFKGDTRKKNYMNNETNENFNKSKEIIDKLKAELNKYKKELEESKKIINYKDALLQNKEKFINDFSKDIKMKKEENAILHKKHDELKMKYDLLLKSNNNIKNDNRIINFDIINNEKNNLEEAIKDLKIQIDLKARENDKLNIKLKRINDEKINKENMIGELNEEIENQKETNENIKKELDEKKTELDETKKELNEKKKESDILRESYKGLENKSKEILIKNKELEKDYNKVYSDNVKLKSNLNKLNEEMENDKVIKEELEKENNILKERNDNLLNDKKELSQKLISIQDDFSNAQKELEKIKNINNDLMEQIKNYQNNGHIEDNKIIDDNDDANNRNDYEQAKKENDTLQKRVIQLNELIQDLNNQINSLNIKYQEQKKENKNLKEVSQALIEKQKNVLEQKDKIDHITPETHYIITKKSYNKLVWYLVSTVNPDNKNDIQINDYDNYKWVTELVIPQSILNRFNKFEDNDTKINDLNAYIQKMQNKLEQKEEEISKKDYANKKLNSQLQNKTANIKQKPFLLNKEFNEQNSHRMNKSNSNQIFTNIKNNANSDAISLGQDVEKYKNLLEQLNDCGEREIKYQNIITKLKAQLKSQDELQSGMNNINDISHHFDSNFIEDEKDDKNVIELLSDIKQKRTKPEKKENTKKEEENFLGILNDVPGNESDLDEVKLLKKQLEFLKDYIKEKDEVINGLIEQIKDLIKDLKWNKKNNQRVTNILTLLGYTPEEIKILIENKKGYNFNFKLIQKK